MLERFKRGLLLKLEENNKLIEKSTQETEKKIFQLQNEVI